MTGKVTRGPFGLDLSVAEFISIPWPSPIRVANAKTLVDHPGDYAGKVDDITDTLTTGFEAQYLGSGRAKVWLANNANTEVRCPRPHDHKDDVDLFGSESVRVRVVGMAYTKNGRYGHLGGSRALVVAQLVEVLPCPPKR